RHRPRSPRAGPSRSDAAFGWRPRPGVQLPRGRRGQPAARRRGGVTRTLLENPLRVVSAGAALFAETLASQGVAVEQVDWRPPANGSPELAARLGRLWDAEI